jgi:hypothetical protein
MRYLSMKRLAGAAMAVAACFGLAGTAFADAAVGGTGVFKRSGGEQYLLVVDWSYVENEQKTEQSSIMLYDRAEAGAYGSASASIVDLAFKTPSGCRVVADLDGDDYRVSVGKFDRCKDFRKFEGTYEPVWTPPEEE